MSYSFLCLWAVRASASRIYICLLAMQSGQYCVLTIAYYPFFLGQHRDINYVSNESFYFDLGEAHEVQVSLLNPRHVVIVLKYNSFYHQNFQEAREKCTKKFNNQERMSTE